MPAAESPRAINEPCSVRAGTRARGTCDGDGAAAREDGVKLRFDSVAGSGDPRRFFDDTASRRAGGGRKMKGGTEQCFTIQDKENERGLLFREGERCNVRGRECMVLDPLFKMSCRCETSGVDRHPDIEILVKSGAARHEAMVIEEGHERAWCGSTAGSPALERGSTRWTAEFASEWRGDAGPELVLPSHGASRCPSTGARVIRRAGPC